MEMPVPVDSAPVSFMLIRTEIFRNLDGFDPHFVRTQEDADLCRRILDGRLGSVVYHPDMQVFYLPVVDNTHLFPARTHRFKSVLRYFMKWGITW